jgi:hypothetical protein
MAGYIIVLATNKETGKHILLNFIWPCHNAPKPDIIFCHAKSVEYWWAVVCNFVIDPDMLVGLIGLRFLSSEIKENVKKMNELVGVQGVIQSREYGDPVRKPTNARVDESLKPEMTQFDEDEDDGDICFNEPLPEDEIIALIVEDNENIIAYLTQSS